MLLGAPINQPEGLEPSPAEVGEHVRSDERRDVLSPVYPAAGDGAPAAPEPAHAVTRPGSRRHAPHANGHAVRQAPPTRSEPDDDLANIVVRRVGRRVGVAGV